MKKKDLTNQVFTYLTVIEPAENRRTKGGRSITRWKCLCKCGKEIIVDGGALTSGNTKSCGCLNLEKIHQPKKNIVGQKFGKLIVKKWRGNGVWECQCDCGNTTLVDHYKLISGNTKTCGCGKYDGFKICQNETSINLTGQKIGKLTVLYKSDKKYLSGKRESIWHCKCECGNEVDIALSSLRKDNPTSSCGCLKSKGELKIIQIFIENNIKFEAQKTFESCRNPLTNNLYYFDFYLPEYNCCIEYDGEQHFHAIEYFGGQDSFQKQKMNDNNKEQWCKENNIKIIRIPYTDYQKINLSYIKERILENGKR